MDKEFKQALADYFEAWDLVDLLELKTDDIIEAFEDVILERVEEMKEHIGYKDIETDEQD